MHPLHDYVAGQVAKELKKRPFLVWYDPRREFAPFVGELRGGQPFERGVTIVSVAGIATRLAEYDGSMFELRVLVEPYVGVESPEPVLIYVPGREHDAHGSILMEIEKAGRTWEPQLKQLARIALLHKFSLGQVDELLSFDRPASYEDLARAAESTGPEPPSVLKAIFRDFANADAMLAAWLAGDGRDADLVAKAAVPELTKLVRAHLGLELPPEESLSKLRSITLRYVLAGEFRSDLRGTPPSRLDSVPAPKTKDDESSVRALAVRLRTQFADEYPAIADRVEQELGLGDAAIPGDALGSIDTFRFEERALLAHCGELIAAAAFDEALGIVAEREHSFWLDRDIGRKAQWEACRRMAELGRAASSVRSAIGGMGGDPGAWVTAYTAPDGWYRVDQTQRRLEAWVANLDEEPGDRPLGVVRRAYDDTCQAMAEGFTRALARSNWAVAASMAQTHIYSEVVAARPKPVAYFLVDAMRFEMGVELSQRLPKTAEVAIRHAVGALPSITPIGMAALQPGASASFSVVEEGGRLGARIDDAFLPDLPARRRFATSRVPKLVDIALDDLLSLQSAKLAKKIDGAQVVLVRSQEIDLAGEVGFPRQARRVMDEVIGDLASAVQRLARLGVEHAVVSADHGHLFSVDRDDSMRIESPGGDQVGLHRRCWIGRGGATPPGCVRVAASALGYVSDLDFVFPVGCGVFKAGGDLAYHHGGPSLQELIVPVVTVRMKAAASPASATNVVGVTGVPDAVTNRIFTVNLLLGGRNPSLFAGPLRVRPLLMSAGRQVGVVGMAIDTDLDRATGSVLLETGKPVTVAFLMNDETVSFLRVVLQDAATDAEIYRSPADIPVRLGI
jgi:hypothetical protein